jgi:hypothetical protein|nr:MAG TPA: nucleic-acid-binding protein [Caudoviricetes sp.]
MAKKRKPRRLLEGPIMCDPYVCPHCEYVGAGYFTCDKWPDGPAVVVEGWMANSRAWRCRKRLTLKIKGGGEDAAGADR